MILAKLLMLIIKFCNCHKDLLNSLESEQNNKESLVLKGIINFDKLFNEKNIKYKIKVDYNLLWNTEKKQLAEIAVLLLTRILPNLE